MKSIDKLTKDKLNDIIRNEISKIVDEDKLLDPPELGDHGYIDYNLDKKYSDYDDEEEIELERILEACGCNDKEGYSLKNAHDNIGSNEMDVYDLQKIQNAFPDATHVVGIDHPSEDEKHSGAYMSRSQLHKIAKYAKELQNIVPEHYNLEDWMRTKLSQISDDISEVYHALDYRKSKGRI